MDEAMKKILVLLYILTHIGALIALDVHVSFIRLIVFIFILTARFAVILMLQNATRA